ncbi:unnamed protein product [Protopolystoma xenopodis]|uniref:Uncharacterized protein n=1 Tax=Protopolystoma xenopodis TaxID=117903 RepID=A0A448XSZ7_9PLAT|nr:unnamed protein product [Protopolystoma xenopodis]
MGQNCALTCAEIYQTPFYNLHIDEATLHELRHTGEFCELSLKRDEDEHSLEMQLPYLAKVMEQYVLFPISIFSRTKSTLYMSLYSILCAILLLRYICWVGMFQLMLYNLCQSVC